MTRPGRDDAPAGSCASAIESPRRRSVFLGAMLAVCGVDVLIVAVKPFVIADPHEAQLYMIAFHVRFGRTIVLACQDADRVPTYFGPPPIARALGRLPFESIPWRRMPLQVGRLQAWKLPIPADGDEATSDDLARTRIVDHVGRTTRR